MHNSTRYMVDVDVVYVYIVVVGERGDLKVYYAIMTIVRSSNWLNDDDDGIGLVWPFALLLILLHVPCLYYLGPLPVLFYFFHLSSITSCVLWYCFKIL